MVAADERMIPKMLHRLEHAAPPPAGVLSVYLDTTADRVVGEAHLKALRDGFKALRGQLIPPDLDHFEQAARRAERFVTEEWTTGHPGLAIFAAAEHDYFYAVDLPEATLDAVTWDLAPALVPLRALLNNSKRAMVLLFDQERSRLFTVHLGEVEHRRAIRDDVPRKQATGGWFGLAQTRMARHHDEHVIRHVNHTVEALLAEQQSRPFQRLVIGGPDEAVAMLKQRLPGPLRSILRGTIKIELFASDAAVLERVRDVLTAVERHEEQTEVEELLEAAVTPHGVVGVEATLAALGEGRVHRILVSDGFAETGGECQRCGRLVAVSEICFSCGGPVRAVTDLRERIVAQALQQRASIEFVSGTAAASLGPVSGLAAWTRY